MSDKSLHQYYMDLMPNLLVELFFFIPEAEIRKDILDKLDVLRKHNMLNKIYVFDNYQGPIEYVKGRNNKHVFLKSGKLEENIFSLIEKRSNTQENEFRYVLDKYVELAECFYQITAWMNTNLTQCVKTDDTTIGIFHLQFHNYKKHFEDLMKQFQLNKEVVSKSNYEVLEIIETHFPDLPNSIQQIAQPPITSLNNGGGVVNTSPKHKKKLITEAAAEKVLLQTFFDI